MRPSEYAEFLADIAANGVETPLEVTAAGVVLDGHHRLRAARELGLERVPVRIVSPANELAYMLRMAIMHRQLEKGQRAALVVELAGIEQLRADARKRQRANLRNQPEVATLPPRGKTRDLLAPQAQVCPRLMHDVLLVHNAARPSSSKSRRASSPPTPPPDAYAERAVIRSCRRRHRFRKARSSSPTPTRPGSSETRTGAGRPRTTTPP
ncbi:MAG: ParB N-terminal domain-containing protein [Actinomycetota bacterium]|nr:ParB N-terminal domain-containing protein [Actinomycetota bacterium]